MLIGHRMKYTEEDVICCCPPLFHCFALVCGIIAPIVYGSTTVIPADVFLAGDSVKSLSEYKCTVILGVATMFEAMLDHPDAKEHTANISLRTGIIAGASLVATLLERIRDEFGFEHLAYAYGTSQRRIVIERLTYINNRDDRSFLHSLLDRPFQSIINQRAIVRRNVASACLCLRSWQ